LAARKTFAKYSFLARSNSHAPYHRLARLKPESELLTSATNAIVKT
jgi:hypothetical protein